jgi:hypothetical protein
MNKPLTKLQSKKLVAKIKVAKKHKDKQVKYSRAIACINKSVQMLIDDDLNENGRIKNVGVQIRTEAMRKLAIRIARLIGEE